MNARDKINYYTKLIEELLKKKVYEELFWAYFERGLYYMDEGEYELALSDFNQAATIKSDESIVYYNIALVYRMMKNDDMAFEYLKKVIEIDNKNPFAYYELARLFYDKERYSEAEMYYTKAIKNGKKGSDIYYRRALTRYKMRMIDGAIDDVNYAIKIKPSAIDYYVLRANISLTSKNYITALSDFEHLIKLKPLHGVYRLNRAIIYATIASVIKLKAKNQIPHILLSDVNKAVYGFESDYHRYYDIAISDLNVAIENEKKVFGDFYTPPSYYLTRGAIYLSYGKYTFAAMDFSVAKSLFKSHFKLKLNSDYKFIRALVEMYLDNYDEARRYLGDETTSKANILRACWWWKAEMNFEKTYFWFKKAFENGFDIFEIVDDIFEGYFLKGFLEELEKRNLLIELLKKS